jgi:hypothetical protein
MGATPLIERLRARNEWKFVGVLFRNGAIRDSNCRMIGSSSGFARFRFPGLQHNP